MIISDKDGRRLELRAMNALEKLRLFKAAGPALSRNEAWLGMAFLACSVAAIDEIPVPMPTDERGIEALVQRLGDLGLAAIADARQPEPELAIQVATAKN